VIQVRVPAGHHQRDEGIPERRGFQTGGGDVALQVIHGDQGKPATVGDRFGNRHADQQRPDQAGPRRHGDRREIGQRHPGIRQSTLDHRRDDLDVPTRRQLGDDPTVRGVHLDLRSHHRAAQDPVAFQDGGGRLVT
jgi:hypothetical protein